ncbi:MAG: CDGSH iron-sulfur domain-containing protein [Phycisphaeraceae bacterium]
MARLIRHEDTGPYEVKASEKSTWICMCGLSKNYPMCDGAHAISRKLERDGKLYRYENGEPIEIGDDLEV